jgi:citrate lyase subunit beta/citryl-CoA lyase
MILDLADSVPAADKADARKTVRETIGRLRGQGTPTDVWVRPNSFDSAMFGTDAQEVIAPGLVG